MTRHEQHVPADVSIALPEHCDLAFAERTLAAWRECQAWPATITVYTEALVRMSTPGLQCLLVLARAAEEKGASFILLSRNEAMDQALALAGLSCSLFPTQD